MYERFKCFNVNFRLLKTIHICASVVVLLKLNILTQVHRDFCESRDIDILRYLYEE